MKVEDANKILLKHGYESLVNCVPQSDIIKCLSDAYKLGEKNAKPNMNKAFIKSEVLRFQKYLRQNFQFLIQIPGEELSEVIYDQYTLNVTPS